MKRYKITGGKSYAKKKFAEKNMAGKRALSIVAPAVYLVDYI